jgi:hypothetical protein
MNQNPLGRLQKIDLREVWLSESGQFTPWLAQAENLKLLSETIGLDLECEAQEKEVGPFRADILCKDTATDAWVLIENQLERTDHCHLGQLLTYAAGLDAVTIVWVAERFTEEHRATLDWLNERTDEKITFFGLEVELWRIGDSPVAPKFNIVSKPNDWTRSVQQAAQGEVSEHNQFQLRFWTAFKDYMEERQSFVKCQKPYPQHWMNHALGRAGLHLTSIISTLNSEPGGKGPEIRAELYLNGNKAKQDFADLEKRKSEIENNLGFVLRWHNPEGKKACRLAVRQDADFLNEALWPQQFEWLRQKLETMHRVFAPIVKTLRSE